MVEQPYYVAEMDGSTHVKYTEIRDAINKFGERQADRYEEKHDRTNGSYTHVEVNDWAYGPLLYIESFDSRGDTEYPTISNSLTTEILEAGYVPWGFRPEKERTAAGSRKHTGRWMWYFRPVEDIVEREFYEVEYAIRQENGKYVRDSSDTLMSFSDRDQAETVAELSNDDLEVVEITN